MRAEARAVSPRWVLLGMTADLLRGSGPGAASAEGVDLVLVRSGAEVRAYQGHCPHQGALLAEGELDGQRLVCRNHRWSFDVQTGQRDGGPECLARFSVREENGQLFVDASQLVSTGAAASPASGPRPVHRRWEDLPGPRRWPWLGNALQIELDQLHLQLEEWAQAHGPVYRLALGPQKVIVTADPAHAAQALRARPTDFRRIRAMENVFGELGFTGVFTAEGDAWRPQRRLAMEALSQVNLRGFYPTLARVAQRLKARWDTAAREGGTVEIQDDLQRFTVDVTASLAFGHDVNTIERGDDSLQEHVKVIFDGINRRINAPIPWWRAVRLPADRRLEAAFAAVCDYLLPRIEDARRRSAERQARGAAAESDHGPVNFLEAMLGARDENGQPFTDKVVLGNAFTMLLAGEDTTAHTLAWAVHLLVDAPAAVETLRAESDGVLGAAEVPAELDAAMRLHFAAAIANETMRLKPVAPMLFLEANHDLVLGDIAVEQGTGVFPLVRTPVLDEKLFPSPLEFLPQRWLKESEAKPNAAGIAASIPFGSGSRICPGRSLALLEMRVALATLFRHFEVERVGPAEDVREHFSFTMSPRGLKVRLKPRGPRA